MTLAISMAPDVLSLTTHDGSRKVYPGEHELIFSTGGSSAAPDQTVAVTVWLRVAGSSSGLGQPLDSAMVR
jgi:hypothetical protein